MTSTLLSLKTKIHLGATSIAVASILIAVEPHKAQAATVIDFQSLEQNNEFVNDVGFTYSEDGFKLTNSSSPFPFAVFGTLGNRYPGSTALFNNTPGGLTTLTKISGGSFNLLSIDLESLNSPQAVVVNFVGTKADGLTTIFQSFTTDSVKGLQTFSFTDFSNLISVSWTQDSSFHQFDNIAIDGEPPSPVPTPALLPGLIGLGVAALRKRNQEESNSAEA